MPKYTFTVGLVGGKLAGWESNNKANLSPAELNWAAVELGRAWQNNFILWDRPKKVRVIYESLDEQICLTYERCSNIEEWLVFIVPTKQELSHFLIDSLVWTNTATEQLAKTIENKDEYKI